MIASAVALASTVLLTATVGGPSIAAPPAAEGAFAPELVQGREGLLLVWAERSADGGTTRLAFSRLTAKGWSEARTIVQGPLVTASWADFPTIAETSSGVLFARWAERAMGSPYASNIVIGSSKDGGKTWRSTGTPHPTDASAEFGFVSLVPVGANSVRAVWLDGRARTKNAGSSAATALRSAIVDRKIHDEAVLDERVCDCCSTAAVASKDGVTIAYRDRGRDEVRDISVAHVSTKGITSTHVHADGWKIEGCPINGPSISSSGADLVVAWFTQAQDRPTVRAAFSKDGGVTFGDSIDVAIPAADTHPLGRVDVAFVGDGDAAVSWVSGRKDEAEVLLARVSPSGSVGAPSSVGRIGAGRDGGSPRMERARDDLVLVWTGTQKPSRIEATRVPIASLRRASALAKSTGTAASASEASDPVQALPEFRASDIDGAEVSRATVAGHPVLLNVWATWCEPCRAELPVLNALSNAYATRGLQVVGVSVDDKVPRAQLASFVKEKGISYTVWADPRQSIAKALRVELLPETVLVDGSGKIVLHRKGALSSNDETLRAAIEKLVSPPAKRP